jgi:hypothetical protein
MKVETIIDVIYEKYNTRRQEEIQIKTSEEYNQYMKQTLHFFRMEIEPYVYQYLTWHYGQKLDIFWETHEFPKKSKYAWVMVERRSHPNLWFVLRNIAWAAPYMSLYIYCSDLNYNYIMRLLGNKAKNVHVIPWFKGAVSRKEGIEQYSLLFKNPEFYKGIDAEYMLTAQTDCFFRKRLPDSIFMTDYYGAPWAWALEKGGGGGINLRNLKRMIEIVSNVPESERLNGEYVEDGWMADHIFKQGNNIPPLEYRINMFSENFPVEDPYGVHQFWTFVQNYGIEDPNTIYQHYVRYLTIDI